MTNGHSNINNLSLLLIPGKAVVDQQHVDVHVDLHEADSGLQRPAVQGTGHLHPQLLVHQDTVSEVNKNPFFFFKDWRF